MATTVFLLRHAAHDRVDSVLCGRMPGVSLGDLGRRQAVALGARLARERIGVITTSPVARARETAEIVAAPLGLRAEEDEALTEIGFGEWTGRSFVALHDDPRWHAWNESREAARPPGGESMVEAQARAVGAVRRAAADHPDGRVAMVSHADVIKGVIAAFLGLSLDSHMRFDVAPASLSALAVWGDGGKVLSVNETVATGAP